MQYYYLIAGLTEYPFDIDNVVSGGLRVDVPQVKAQVMGELSPLDRRAVELLYTYYDIENIVGYVRGSKLPFNVLGNLSREDVKLLVDRSGSSSEGDTATLLPEELAEREAELTVPRAVRLVVDRFRGDNGEDGGAPEPDDFAPLGVDDLERELFLSFYRACGAVSVNGEGGFSLSDLRPGSFTVPEYLRQWAEYDRTVRNIVAAFKARQLGLTAEQKEGMIVEPNAERRDALINGQAQDFGMKDVFPYAEELLQVLETEDFVERERRMDALRVQMADDLAEHDYFGIGRVMDYLIRLNILHRWASLDAERGRGNFREMVSALTDPEKIAEAVSAKEQ